MKKIKEQVVSMKDELEQKIQAELAAGYQRIFAKPLPAILDSGEIENLGVRPGTSLDKDVAHGIGLQPLPGSGGKGRPRKYLLSHVVAHLAAKQRLSHAQ